MFYPLWNYLNFNILILILIFLDFLPKIIFSNLIHLNEMIPFHAEFNQIDQVYYEYTEIEDKDESETNPPNFVEPLNYHLYIIWVILHQ